MNKTPENENLNNGIQNASTKGFSFKGFAKGVVKGLIFFFCIFIVGYLFCAWIMYSDYTVRTRISEGLVLAASAKNLVVDNAVNGYPYDQGWSAITPTNNIASIEIARATGVITIVGTKRADNIVLLLTPMVDETPLSGQKIEGRIYWVCSEPTGKVPPHDIPPECR
jgi:type IV pilus assembly protein PilA